MKNIPFGLPGNKEIVIRDREVNAKVVALYESKLAEYGEVLDYYKKGLNEYLHKLEGYNEEFLDNRHIITQSAIDISYLKEQGDRTTELLESMRTSSMNKILFDLEELLPAVSNISTTLEGMDKNVVNQLSELLMELQKQLVFHDKQVQMEQTAKMEKATKNEKKRQGILWFLFLFQVLSMAALAFLILNSLGFISI